jgi:preprotein translocase subunit Sec61beta
VKKFKFQKPFISLKFDDNYTNKSLKERWKIALHDPAYLVLTCIAITSLIIAIINYYK